MTLGKKVRELRITKGITQEKLAQLLMVSPQAVSRWETDAAMPDITLLASIANYFEVTTDELLGVDIPNKKEKIKEYAEEYGKFASTIQKTEVLRQHTIRKLREGLRLYPDAKILKQQLTTTLWMNTEVPADMEEKKEMCRLCKELIEETTDIKEKCRYISLYCSYARFTGNSEEGRVLAGMLPETAYTRQRFLALCCEDDGERNEQLYEYMRSSWGALRDAMLLLIIDGKNSPEEILKIRKKQEEIRGILFDRDDIVKYEDFDEYKVAKAFYKSGDFGRTIDYLEICFKKWTERHPIKNVSSWWERGREPYLDNNEPAKVIKGNAEDFIKLLKTDFSMILSDERIISLIEKANQIVLSYESNKKT